MRAHADAATAAVAVFHLHAGVAAVAAVLATAATVWVAHAMTVQPIVVDLKTSGRQMSAIVTVENSFDKPLPVELQAQEATFSETGLTPNGAPANDLLIFPPQALVAPGQTQSFRIQWVGDPALVGSKHFFVTVGQLPVQLPEGQSAIQILYNFQVVVNVGPAAGRPDIHVLRADIVKGEYGKFRPTLYLDNTGTTYGYLSSGRLRIVQTDDAGREVYRRSFTPAEVQQNIGFGLVAASGKRTLPLTLELPAGEGKLDVQFTPENAR